MLDVEKVKVFAKLWPYRKNALFNQFADIALFSSLRIASLSAFKERPSIAADKTLDLKAFLSDFDLI